MSPIFSVALSSLEINKKKRAPKQFRSFIDFKILFIAVAFSDVPLQYMWLF